MRLRLCCWFTFCLGERPELSTGFDALQDLNDPCTRAPTLIHLNCSLNSLKGARKGILYGCIILRVTRGDTRSTDYRPYTTLYYNPNNMYPSLYVTLHKLIYLPLQTL